MYDNFDEMDGFDILFERNSKHLARKIPSQTTKQVRFSNFVDVFLIPQKEELKKHFDLWLSENDFATAHQTAIKDIKRLLEIHPCMRLCEAKKLLYQPNNIRYDPSNFSDYS